MTFFNAIHLQCTQTFEKMGEMKARGKKENCDRQEEGNETKKKSILLIQTTDQYMLLTQMNSHNEYYTMNKHKGHILLECNCNGQHFILIHCHCVVKMRAKKEIVGKHFVAKTQFCQVNNIY